MPAHDMIYAWTLLVKMVVGMLRAPSIGMCTVWTLESFSEPVALPIGALPLASLVAW
ncbi:hypothetical protein CDES_11520 [Corynebacterium deserti GIMN1.010]|uniref:Uncharacterized protein n=1 Tax=Corynebacterium deserti GIMN1.010 TaxID=931089 RepID=A0A0M5IUG2_9CORY|nr:hypothetical protein CDES_11520 [Corynebacterium deserti GIMN1.010]